LCPSGEKGSSRLIWRSIWGVMIFLCSPLVRGKGGHWSNFVSWLKGVMRGLLSRGYIARRGVFARWFRGFIWKGSWTEVYAEDSRQSWREDLRISRMSIYLTTSDFCSHIYLKRLTLLPYTLLHLTSPWPCTTPFSSTKKCIRRLGEIQLDEIWTFYKLCELTRSNKATIYKDWWWM